MQFNNQSEEIIIYVDGDSDVNPNASEHTERSELNSPVDFEESRKLVHSLLEAGVDGITELSDDVDQSQFIYIDGDFTELISLQDEETDQIVRRNSRQKLKSYGSELILCNVCGKLIKEKNMSRHLIGHGKEECDVCGKSFETYDEMKNHQGEHLGDEFPCDFCDASYEDALDYVVHVYKHTGIYSCLVCPFVTSNKTSIKGHIRRHEGKYTHYCNICGKGFLGRALLESHEEMHLDIKRYTCDICDKKFSVKRYLHIHRSLNHRKELFGIDQLFQCEVCGREFTFEKSLRRHQSVIHHIGEDRTVECNVCHKIIANNYNLKMHMRIHTGEKKYCCDLCGKAFTAHKYWKKHRLAHEKQDKSDFRNEIVDRELNVFRLDDMEELELDSDNFIVDFDTLD